MINDPIEELRHFRDAAQHGRDDLLSLLERIGQWCDNPTPAPESDPARYNERWQQAGILRAEIIKSLENLRSVVSSSEVDGWILQVQRCPILSADPGPMYLLVLKFRDRVTEYWRAANEQSKRRKRAPKRIA